METSQMWLNLTSANVEVIFIKTKYLELGNLFEVEG